MECHVSVLIWGQETDQARFPQPLDIVFEGEYRGSVRPIQHSVLDIAAVLLLEYGHKH